jgi:acyl CoA:acetate/3-ketoacid CoA transferase alpha subunit
MEARDALSKIEAGDKIKVEGFSQTFTATKVMFDGEMVD